jgi:hypothetical protein
MNRSSQLKLTNSKSLLVAIFSIAMLGACGPSDLGADRLKPIKSGASQAELLQAMGQGPLVASGADTMRVINGFRRQEYLVQGNQYEVIWFRAEPGSLTDPITKASETPIVLNADTVMGWGWKYYQGRARALDLPDPTRDAERLDSISKSQQKGA